MAKPFQGSCLCGAIRFEADQFMPRTGNCHCSMCRKFHGAAFATLAETARDHFRWLAGADHLKRYTADNGTTRTFCDICGSSLTFHTPNEPGDLVEIALGLFDDAVPIEPDAHIFVGSGADWHTITDDLPQYEAGRDSPRLK